MMIADDFDWVENYVPNPPTEQFDMLVCFDDLTRCEKTCMTLKHLVNDSAKHGYRITKVDDGDDLGNDFDGNPIVNKRRNKIRVHFKKF